MFTSPLSLLVLSVLHVCLARSPLDSQVWHSYDDRGSSYHHDSTQSDSEASSRDLDIGFTVGDVAREGYRDPRLSIGAFPDDPYRGGGLQPGQLRRWGQGDDAFQGMVLGAGGDTGVVTQPLEHKVGEVKLPYWGGGLQPVQLRRWGQGDDAFQGMVLDAGGDTRVVTQPLEHKVGEVKLRNDQGYQLSMYVPPSSVGDRPGVLKIDLKATLYRPIYY